MSNNFKREMKKEVRKRFRRKESIKEIEIERDTICLKKNKLFGWGVVYPCQNDDGSINWFNLFTGGSWIRLILTIIIVALILLVIAEYSKNINNLIGCFENLFELNNCVEIFNPNISQGYLP